MIHMVNTVREPSGENYLWCDTKHYFRIHLFAYDPYKAEDMSSRIQSVAKMYGETLNYSLFGNGSLDCEVSGF